jgi:hypothetical protein
MPFIDQQPSFIWTMDFLSDNQAQQIRGGRFSASMARGQGPGRGMGMGLAWRNSFLAVQSVFTTVNQVNLAINVALNGGTVINNQANGLSIVSSL